MAAVVRSYCNKCWFHYAIHSYSEDNKLSITSDTVPYCKKSEFHSSLVKIMIKLNGYEFCAFMHYLQYSPRFLRVLFNDKIRRISNPSIRIFVRLRNPPGWPLDITWNCKILVLVERYLELEKLTWWLSTLGGAFSALGDHAVAYAYQAGRISREQLKLALELGDAVLISRCKLFIALSFVQTNRLRIAKRIIREQYKFAAISASKLLKNCCLGVWSKLRYAYSVRKQSHILRQKFITNNGLL